MEMQFKMLAVPQEKTKVFTEIQNNSNSGLLTHFKKHILLDKDRPKDFKIVTKAIPKKSFTLQEPLSNLVSDWKDGQFPGVIYLTVNSEQKTPSLDSSRSTSTSKLTLNTPETPPDSKSDTSEQSPSSLSQTFHTDTTETSNSTPSSETKTVQNKSKETKPTPKPGLGERFFAFFCCGSTNEVEPIKTENQLEKQLLVSYQCLGIEFQYNETKVPMFKHADQNWLCEINGKLKKIPAKWVELLLALDTPKKLLYAHKSGRYNYTFEQNDTPLTFTNHSLAHALSGPTYTALQSNRTHFNTLKLDYLKGTIFEYLFEIRDLCHEQLTQEDWNKWKQNLATVK